MQTFFISNLASASGNLVISAPSSYLYLIFKSLARILEIYLNLISLKAVGMKGKVRCPNCSFVFIVESEKEGDKKVRCPKCGYEFIAKVGKVKSKDVKWIEYGGTRKAILPIPEKLTNRPLIAGILLAISSMTGILTVLMFYLYGDVEIWTLYKYIPPYLIQIFSILVIIFSVIALFGSYCAIKKRSSFLASIGCVFGIISFGFLIIGPILSIISLILILVSKDEFEKSLHGKEF